MKIGILISKESWQQFTNVDRLEEAAKQLGHTTVRLYEPNFLFSKGVILYDGKPLPDLDVILPRPNFIEEPSLHMFPIRLLKEAGYRLINADHDLAWSKNKIEQLMRFDEKSIPHPESAITKNPEQALEAATRFGFPVILKIAFGTHGKGVFYASDEETFQPIAEYLAIRDGNPIIVQRFVEEADRKDIRVFVVGDNIVGAMQRTAPSGDVRANTSTGGVGSTIELTKKEQKLALKVARDTKLDIAGVDMLRSKNGPLVLEVNANPGFKTLEEVSGVNIAEAIIKFVTK